MNKELLFNACLATATAVVTSSSLAHGHPPYVIDIITDMAFTLYEKLEPRVAVSVAQDEVKKD